MGLLAPVIQDSYQQELFALVLIINFGMVFLVSVVMENI
jgi:hypothetical protein